MQFRTGSPLEEHTFTIDGRGRMRMLSYKGPMGQRFSIPFDAIATVSLTPQQRDVVQFVVVGEDEDLAHVPMGRPFAEAAQAWVLERVSRDGGRA